MRLLKWRYWRISIDTTRSPTKSPRLEWISKNAVVQEMIKKVIAKKGIIGFIEIDPITIRTLGSKVFM